MKYEIGNGVLYHGDNIEIMETIHDQYKGQVKAIITDPPYNAKSGYAAYKDSFTSDEWLKFMAARLRLMWDFLSEDGSLWINIDQDESHYLKVLMDKIFGRDKFFIEIIWEKRHSTDGRLVMTDTHESILVYAKNPSVFKKTANMLPTTQDQIDRYKNPDNDPNGPWKGIPITATGFRKNQMYPIEIPSTGEIIYPTEGSCWRWTKERFDTACAEGGIYFGVNGDMRPRIKKYLTEVKGIGVRSIWRHEEVGNTQDAKNESKKIFGAANTFGTPKPEKLLERIIHIATNEEDLVMDIFAGSGTTLAVAQKMNRKWIGIEMGEQCVTHCKPRLEGLV